MTAISKEYLLLFNVVTDAEKTLAQLRETLLEAQRQAEELFLEESGEDASYSHRTKTSTDCGCSSIGP